MCILSFINIKNKQKHNQAPPEVSWCDSFTESRKCYGSKYHNPLPSSSVLLNEAQLRRAGHCQFLQVVHENLQAHVIGEDRSARLLSPSVEVIVGLRRVDLGQQEACL